MAVTAIANVWTPDIWIQSIREKKATFPSIWDSGVVVNTPQMDAIAAGGGVSANMPMWKDITDQDDEAQVEDTAPVTTNIITTGVMVAPIVNRVYKAGGSALAAAITGEDPVNEITQQLADGRQKRRQKRLLSILRGLFGSAGAANAACALSACRLGGVTAEPFDETGNDATDDQKFSPDMFIDAKTLMGELASDLSGGLLFMHPTVIARLEKLDKDGFKSTIKPSELPFAIKTYREIPIIASEALVRAGTGAGANGYVYDTYLMARGTVGFGQKPQVGGAVNNPIKDVASLNMVVDADKNNEYVWDRTREVVHVNGTKWLNAVMAGQSATNAELATVANWSLIYQTANRVGAVCIRTNG
jgi:hypothetical protein